MSKRGFARRLLSSALAAVVATGVLSGCGSEASAGIINLYNAPQENLSTIVDRCNERANGDYRIVLNALPRDADSQREQLVRRLAAGDTGMDVLGVDITWTAELASAKWILPWTGSDAAEAKAGVVKAPLETAMFEGKMYGAPYTANVQLLWYRADLMPEPAQTWSQLISAAKKLAKEDKPHYMEVTGAQYEGLVVWFSSMVSAAGGSILNPAGDKVELGKPAVKALEQMRQFANSPAADPSLSNMQEDQVRLAVESGAGFAELNWPFVYASMADNKPAIAENFKWAPYPGIDGPGKAPLGGVNFAISKFTTHEDEAFDAALCLRDKESQRLAAVNDGLPPAIESVYSAKGMAKAYPMRDQILDALGTAEARPVTPVYQNVSTVTSKYLSPPASIDPSATERDLTTQLADALKSEGVLP